jgi:hypothetical protein
LLNQQHLGAGIVDVSIADACSALDLPQQDGLRRYHRALFGIARSGRLVVAYRIQFALMQRASKTSPRDLILPT